MTCVRAATPDWQDSDSRTLWKDTTPVSVDEPLTTEAIGRPNRLGIGIIGAGRVGAVLGRALQQAGHTITSVHAVSEASVARAEALLPEAPIIEIPDILRRSEAVIFAVPDDVLESLVSGLAAAGHIQTGHLLVHTSGRYGTAVMDPVREHGATPVVIPPAMTQAGASATGRTPLACPAR